MYGIANEQANLDYIAQRQADFEAAARHRRLIHTLKSARRDKHDQATITAQLSAPRCRADLG